MLTLKSKKQVVHLGNTLSVDESNNFEITYTFSVLDGNLEGAIEASAIKEGRQVLSKQTSDGKQFYGHSNEMVEDDLGTLAQVMKSDMNQIVANPTEFLTV